MFQPKVSFVMPVFNEERRIARSLNSIRSQKYPQEKIEIVLADGGSTDKTRETTKQFSVRLLDNKLKLAEPGVSLATEKATGDICIVMAADNVLPHQNWLSMMTTPFANHSIIAAFTQIIPAKDDTLFSQYVSLLHADPFNEFIYGKAANPKYYGQIYKTIEKNDDYVVFSFPLENFPLIAMAQGFAFRENEFLKRKDIYDDISPILELIKQKKKIAYVPQAGIYHYSFYGFSDFLQKYDKRIKNGIEHGYNKRVSYLSPERKIRQYLWVFYSLSIIFPLATMVSRMVKEKKAAYFYHPFACFCLTLLVIKNVIVSKIK